MSIKKTKEQFIEEAKQIHGDRYDYSKVEYTGNKNKVKIICLVHGEFKQTPNSHLSGQDCPSCSGNIKKTTEQFIEESKQTHGNLYDYSLVEYTNTMNKVKIICSIHGEFEQIANDHVRGRGCSSCAKGGFNPKKPATFYYFSIPDIRDESKLLYKIGITNFSLRQRYNKTDFDRMSNIFMAFFEDGQKAYDEEQRLIKEYKNHLWKGKTPFTDGTLTSELFKVDILKLDNYLFNLLKPYEQTKDKFDNLFDYYELE